MVGFEDDRLDRVLYLIETLSNIEKEVFIIIVEELKSIRDEKMPKGEENDH